MCVRVGADEYYGGVVEVRVIVLSQLQPQEPVHHVMHLMLSFDTEWVT